MNFRSLSDLVACVRDHAHRLPPDIDLVVGIPRSGMIPATQLALIRNLPVIDLERFLADREQAFSYSRRRFPGVGQAPRKVLIVDDSVGSGSTLSRVRADVAKAFGGHAPECLYLAVYWSGRAAKGLDMYFEKVAFPRVFEWNLLHHKALEHACVDIDGVLCRDPTALENDDAGRYRAFLNSVPAKVSTNVAIGWLVTSRLEKYRQETAAWLERNKIGYRQLVMLDLPDMRARQASDAHAAFKGRFYRECPAQVFIESEPAQAAKIARIAGKNVICTADWRLYTPESASPVRAYQAGRAFLRRTRNRLVRLLHRTERIASAPFKAPTVNRP